MPMASDSTAVSVNIGLPRSVRAARRRSRQVSCHITSSRGTMPGPWTPARTGRFGPSTSGRPNLQLVHVPALNATARLQHDNALRVADRHRERIESRPRLAVVRRLDDERMPGLAVPPARSGNRTAAPGTRRLESGHHKLFGSAPWTDRGKREPSRSSPWTPVARRRNDMRERIADLPDAQDGAGRFREVNLAIAGS